MKGKLFFKTIILVLAVIVGAAVFVYPFPGVCYECPLLQRLSGFLFQFFGFTAFFISPVIIAALFFRKNEKVRKYLKYTLYLWVSVLLNLGLLRDLFEIEAPIGGAAGWLFTAAYNNGIDFLFLFLPILVLDLVILYFLGVDIIGIVNKLFKPEEKE